MPTLREIEVTEALISLNNTEPFTSIEDDDASGFFYEDDAVRPSDPTVTGNYVEVPLFESEQFFGSTIESSSTYTPSDALQMNFKSRFLRLSPFPVIVILFLFLDKEELEREMQSQGSGNSLKYIKTLRFKT
jgi:hypothetical protein